MSVMLQAFYWDSPAKENKVESGGMSLRRSLNH